MFCGVGEVELVLEGYVLLIVFFGVFEFGVVDVVYVFCFSV